MYRLDPTNTNIPPLIERLLEPGHHVSPGESIQTVDSLLRQNPRRPDLLHTKWQLQLRAKDYHGALATGSEMIEVDTSQANLDYFQRSIAVAGLDSNRALQQQLIGQAMQKFGNKVPVDLPLALAAQYYKAGLLMSCALKHRAVRTARGYALGKSGRVSNAQSTG